MAVVVPPTAMIVHYSFNLLYQFWIHTELIGDLGPLEYVLNTSNHHRVHHGSINSVVPFAWSICNFVFLLAGSNRYCLDKNYAGVLIIWDRLFGTFEKFRPEEEITYGLVDQPQFFNPLRHQVKAPLIFSSCHHWSSNNIGLCAAVLHEVCLWESLQYEHFWWQSLSLLKRTRMVPRNWEVGRSANGARGSKLWW